MNTARTDTPAWMKCASREHFLNLDGLGVSLDSNRGHHDFRVVWSGPR